MANEYAQAAQPKVDPFGEQPTNAFDPGFLENFNPTFDGLQAAQNEKMGYPGEVFDDHRHTNRTAADVNFFR